MMFKTLQEAEDAFQNLKNAGLKIDMTRGKPGPEQLDLSSHLDGVLQGNYIAKGNVDTRNYGGVHGITEARELMSHCMGTTPAETMVIGNSSLQLMYQYLQFRTHELFPKDLGQAPKFLAPSPGYDRHFWITEQMGVTLMPVPYVDNGPDMKMCEELVAQDASIRGIWCVPKYSNPTGHVYSDDTIKRMALLPSLSKGTFQVMWDNAYSVHDFGEYQAIASIMEYAKEAGTAKDIAVFASTSKITFAGAGIASIGLDAKQVDAFAKYLNFQTIGPDKTNQLRHTKAFPTFEAILEHMKKHASILKPKFDAVTQTLREILGTGDANVSWNDPKGGYFIDLSVPGIAKEVVALCAEAGVTLTPSGAAIPGGVDPKNGQIRLAPSFPSPDENRKAAQVIGTAIRLARLRKLT